MKLGEELYRSALSFQDSETFSKHLQSRSERITGLIQDLYSRLPQSSPEVQELQGQLNELLAREKENAVELRKAIDEKESLEERLEQASYRYMTAEKKLDRSKSAQVQKLERAAIMGADASSPTAGKKAASGKKDSPEVNGDLENGVASAEAEAGRREALAAAEKQKSQLEEVEVENERLTNLLSEARTKLVTLTNDDYAETSLCKTLRSQHEDAVKRLNDFEATNKQLREDLQKLQAERLSYRSAVDDEHRTNNVEIEVQSARAETDLVRIRDQRDNLQAEASILKSANEVRRVSADQAKELAAARDSKISALESEVERLKLQIGESQPDGGDDTETADLDTLRTKLRTLEQQYSLLSNELPSMEAAWKKTQVLASKKVEETARSEEQLVRLSADKAKTEQKYFAIMKTKDMQTAELRTLKSQNARSSEIVSQLKDADSRTRELVSSLERQVAESKEALNKLEQQHRTLQQKSKEAGLSTDGLKKQVEDLKTMVTSKDKDAQGSGKAKREAEEELEKCKARLDDLRRQHEKSKKESVDLNSKSDDAWRVSLALIAVNSHLDCIANMNHRASSSAPCATSACATRCSSSAGTASASRASRTSSRTARASVRAVLRVSATATIRRLYLPDRRILLCSLRTSC